jgi:hypothetical protein
MITLQQQVSPAHNWPVPRGLALIAILMLAVVAILLVLDLTQLLHRPDASRTKPPLTIHVLGDCR